MVNQQRNRNELNQYWKNPDGENQPRYYMIPVERSRFLHETIKRYANTDAKILEPGCNVGRNLNYLYEAGFAKLTGIEINPNVVELLNQSYPKMARTAKIYNAPIEDVISKFKRNEFDIVYTMAVLEHIHTDSNWIFSEMQRITKSYLITIEDEAGVSERHFPRNYKQVFEPLGFAQIEEQDCQKVMGSGFELRVFKKVP